MGGLNIDQILSSLQNVKTAEQAFEEGLAGKPLEKTAEAIESVAGVNASEEDMQKIAEADAFGRIMARAYVEELIKCAEILEQEDAVEPTVETEKVAEVGNDPRVNILTQLYNQNF